MGTLHRIGLRELVRAHRLDTLVETGTGHGHSLLCALQVPELAHIHSVEIDRETWHRAFVTFRTEPRVHLYHGTSPEVLPQICANELQPEARVLWFLDAHYPGSGRLNPLPMVADDGPHDAVPLVAELGAIREGRGDALALDAFVVDDLCLFEAGAYDSDAPELREALGFGSLDWVDEALADTHDLYRFTRDGGYLIARPRA